MYGKNDRVFLGVVEGVQRYQKKNPPFFFEGIHKVTALNFFFEIFFGDTLFFILLAIALS